MPSIAMPPPHLAGTTEIRPQPLAMATAGPNTADNNVSMPHQHMNERPLYAPATTDMAMTTNTTTMMDVAMMDVATKQ